MSVKKVDLFNTIKNTVKKVVILIIDTVSRKVYKVLNTFENLNPREAGP